MAKVDLSKFKSNAKKALSKKETHGIFKEATERIQTVPLESLEEGLKVRLFQKDLTPLKKSIESMGQLEPVVVRRKGERYEVLDGYRRVAVARELGKADIAAEILEVDDAEAPLLPFILNAPESFDIIETALYLRRLVKKFGMSEEAIYEKTGLKVSDYKELFFEPGDKLLENFNTHFEGLLKRYFRIVRGELDIEKNGVRVKVGMDNAQADARTKAEVYRFIYKLSLL
ncbi:ParB/RepB/Spo0J family partition protein [Hydrogenimonas sp.]